MSDRIENAAMVSDETIQQAAVVIAGKTTELGSSTMRGLDRAILAARDLAEAGLLAPAPLTEEWGAEMDHPIPDRPPSTIKARDLENARWQVEHNPKAATGRIMHRYVSDWEEA